MDDAQQSSWLASSAFAALCGTTKETLRHYRDMGLLMPVHRGGNGYFYYDAGQFYDFYAISIFRQTGTPLEEIRRCLPGQDTAGTLAQLREQQGRLEAERRRLEQMEFVLSGMIRNLESGMAQDLVPRRVWFEQEHLLALPSAELERLTAPQATEDERIIAVLTRCRTLCREYEVQTDFQLGAVHRPGKQAEPAAITHLYTRINRKVDCPYYMEKPAGYYVCLCCRGRWDLSAGYAALSRHIRDQGLQTAGNYYTCDLAGFILNGVEKNAASLISVRIREG